MPKYHLQKQLCFLLLLTGCTILYSFIGQNVETLSARGNRADSVFIPNTTQGWHVFSSYQESYSDSIRFEMILFRNAQLSNWGDSLEVGSINATYAPSSVQIVEYIEMPRLWKITILPQGTCYFQLLSGPTPTGNPIVIPVITYYKK